ncbi:unnamed protein product [Brassicogethes aeneus]|uniref:RBD domain-containing protein n=1 Tax=Brassicogethes aeneus TaxID=1431903 RepID=A0A9P0B052_BRAAE|nr:unnamed protein product [Brassicogethes aeneus]
MATSIYSAMAVLPDIDRLSSNKKILNGSTNFLPNADKNSDKMSTDSEDLNIREELKNIESVIILTRNNIDALNDKFASFQHPPPMYLKEYDHLTSKLHELEAKERRLREQLSSGRETPEDLCNQAQNYPIPPDLGRHYDTLPRAKFLRAYLPNQQRTSVQVREGLTLREALSKAMKLRNLICDMCCVYLGDNPWRYVEICGNPWRSVEIHGCPVEIRGDPVEIRGNPVEIRRDPRTSAAVV